MKDLEIVESQMREVYENNAIEFDQQRSKSLFEKKWLDKFLDHLKKNDSVLDVGCGSAEPIAKYLIENELSVTGIDYSESMLQIAKRRYPENQWIKQDMRELQLNQQFHGIIAWNSFFHLTQEAQRSTLILFSKHLKSNGILLLTVGPEAGECDGEVNGKRVYHSSLSIDEYQRQLEEVDFEILDFIPSDTECFGHSVLLAKKR